MLLVKYLGEGKNFFPLWELGCSSVWHCAAMSAVQGTAKKARATMALVQGFVEKDGPNVAWIFIETKESAD